MALLQHKALADYKKQVEAFQSFLEKFETSKISPDAATEAIGGLDLDGDQTSDEYDFMDDVAERDGSNSRRRPKRKYLDMLLDVANRERPDVLIELDDLREVCGITQPNLATITNASIQFEDSLGADSDLHLVESITKNTKHYIDLFSDAVDMAMPEPTKAIS